MHYALDLKGTRDHVQLRTYTLRSAEALDRYAAIHWARHIGSLEAFGVETRGIWTSRDGGENRLFALVSYENGADPARVETEYMAGSAFGGHGGFRS